MNLNLIYKRSENFRTPFYAYDLGVLHQALHACKSALPAHFHVHYAIKANTQEKILNAISANGFGADCVSYNEVKQALSNGFKAEKIVFAGVGKSDEEIRLALHDGIYCFNVESVQELSVIAEIAQSEGLKARVALRLNPNVKANTHKYITTGLNQNKFGIDAKDVEEALRVLTQQSDHLTFEGLHFHIGSQITDLENFKQLCLRANEWHKQFSDLGFASKTINVGGGLGIDYLNPQENLYPDFASFFGVYQRFLELPQGVEVHFELGRALVANCAALITKVLYEKNNGGSDFLIVDAGLTELLRPALYSAYHKIILLNDNVQTGDEKNYVVAGPICESSDVFSKKCPLPHAKRGDLLAILSAGAYGQVMQSSYNLREPNEELFI